jgi:ribokinase
MEQSRPSVLVVGSVNQDLVVRVERLPTPGETVLGDRFERHGGGKGANQAVAAQRAGAAVTLVGAVGSDDLGRAALSELAREGIALEHVVTIEGMATGVALIAVDRQGENQIALAPGANMEVAAEQVEAAFEAGCPAVCLVSLEVPLAAVEAAAECALRASVRFVVNPGPARPLPRAVLDAHPILLPNEAELEVLAPDHGGSAVALAARTVAPVIVTRGSHGATLFEGDSTAELPAFPVTARDTTGAGDTFAGVLSAGLANGLSLREAADRAMAAAAISTTRPGARGGMPQASEIDSFLEAARRA